MKLLAWLVFFGLVAAALWVKRSINIKVTRLSQHEHQREYDDTGAERMVRCAHCGVYIPASEAIQYRGNDYCCEAHCGKPPIF